MKVVLAIGTMLVGTILCHLFFAPSLVLAEVESDTTDVRWLFRQVDSLIKATRFDEAVSVGTQAVEKARERFGDSDTTLADALDLLGVCYSYKADYAQCESLYNEALAIREKCLGQEHPDVATSLNHLAILYRQQSKYEKAEVLHWRELTIREKALGLKHPRVAKTLVNLGFLFLGQGRYAEAEPLFKRALNIYEISLGADHLDITSCLNSLGLLYRFQGKYTLAEPLFKRTLEIRERVLGPDHHDVASALNNLGILYRKQGKYEEAEHLYSRALDIEEKTLGPDNPALAQTLNNLAVLCRHRGKYSEAEPLFERALHIYEKAWGSDHHYVAITSTNLAIICRRQGKYSKADSLYRRALAIMKSTLGPNHVDVASALNDLAFSFYCQGRYPEAEPLFERALTIMEKTLSPEHPSVSSNLESMALLYSSIGNIDTSLLYYEKLQRSRQHFIEYVFSYASEDQKIRYVEKHPLLNHCLLSFAIMTNLDESRGCALEMILKAKAVVIDAMAAEKETACCSYSDKTRKLAERHAEVCGEISTMTLAGARKLDPEKYGDQLRALYRTKDSLETELSTSCTEFRDMLAVRRFSVADVAKTLPKRSVLWEFVRYKPYDFNKVGNSKERTGAPRYLAFTLDDAGNMTLNDLGNAWEIDSLVSLAREQIYRARKKAHSPLIVELEEQLSGVTGKLYAIIFAPLESYLGDRTDIFISPDGQLNLLPFEILPCPDGEYVVEKYSISYLSSGRDLLKFKEGQASSDWALVMADPDYDLSGEALARQREKVLDESVALAFAGDLTRDASDCLQHTFDPLPYGRLEGDSVMAMLAAMSDLQTKFYYGEKALEEVLKGMQTAPKILHLITHGFTCEDLGPTGERMIENPLLRSGLALAGANRRYAEATGFQTTAEDGILTAFESSGLNLLGTEFAVLSSCETGMGEVRNGEGVFGLRRAFQIAGAQAIIMSLWKIPDKETCQLMSGFYRNWLAGSNKKEALRKSALEVLSNCRDRYGTGHPFFWGAFVLTGNPG